MSTDTNLRGAPVTVSYLNPQTNTYTQIGKTFVVATRKSGTVLICVLGADRTPISAVPVTPAIDWIIQNEVYCTYVDTKKVRYLLLFATPDEARLFTSIALAAKLQQDKSPICIVKKEGTVIQDGERFAVKVNCYNVAEKIEAPVLKEEYLEVAPSDDTPLNSLSGSGQIGSTYLVKFSETVVAVAEIIPRAQQPPKAKAPSEEPKVPKESQEKTKTDEKKPAPKPDKEDEPVEEPGAHAKELLKQMPKVTPKAKRVYDPQFEVIRQDMQARFDAIAAKMAALRRKQAASSDSASSTKLLISSVQRLLKENEAKDRLIAEKQQILDQLNAENADTRERDVLRHKLADLGTQLTFQQQLTKEKIQLQKRLRERIEELGVEIVKAKENGEDKLVQLRQQLDDEKQKQLEDLEKKKEQLEKTVVTVEAEAVEVRAQYEKALEENKELSEKADKDFGQELEKLKERIPLLIQHTVKQMVTGVYEIIEQEFDEDEDYDGITAAKTIQTALETQTREMLDEVDPNGEHRGAVEAEAEDDEEEED